MTKFEKEVDYTKSISWQSFPNDKKDEVVTIFENAFKEKERLESNIIGGVAEARQGELTGIHNHFQDLQEPAVKIVTSHFNFDVPQGCQTVAWLEGVFENTDQNESLKKSLEVIRAAAKTSFDRLIDNDSINR